MTPSTLKSRDVPGVLYLPVARRQEDASDQRRPALAGRSREWLPILGDDAEPEHPVGMLTAASERPLSVNPPTASCRLGRSRRLGRAGNDHVRAVLVDLLISLPRQPGREDVASGTDHRDPADRTVNSAECSKDLQRRRQIELQPAMALRHLLSDDNLQFPGQNIVPFILTRMGMTRHTYSRRQYFPPVSAPDKH
jgi:hypothetical protein